jgi:hypothetical protein
MPKPLKLALRVSVISWCCEWMSPEVQVIGMRYLKARAGDRCNGNRNQVDPGASEVLVIGLRHLEAASYQRCAALVRLPGAGWLGLCERRRAGCMPGG